MRMSMKWRATGLKCLTEGGEKKEMISLNITAKHGDEISSEDTDIQCELLFDV